MRLVTPVVHLNFLTEEETQNMVIQQQYLVTGSKCTKTGESISIRPLHAETRLHLGHLL